MKIQKSPSCISFHRLLPAGLLAAMCVLPAAGQAPSNAISCGTNITGAALPVIPEIRAQSDGILRGTMYTVSEQQKMTATSAGPGSTPYCFPQWVRAYRRAAPASWDPPSSQLLDPMPGPTLRARVGGMVELTFLNVIDSNKFPNADKGCDQTSVYPGSGQGADKYPDCFSGSVFTNMHYHGTHTSPNTTGDNVFLQIRPSPRKTDGTNAPVIDASTVQAPFTEFFGACEEQLKLATGPKIWPRVWSDLSPTLQSTLMDPLKQYAPEWYAANLKQIASGYWPQYYVGAVPYCFKLPEYQANATSSAAIPASARTPHSHGLGSSEVDEAEAPTRPLLMGQAPGTHWYHAHKHGSTTINVMNGMTGALIIEGQYDDDINKVYGADWTRSASTKVMVINQLGSVPGLVVGKGFGPGPDFSVNGRLRPTVTMAGNSVQMWRIVNSSSRAGAYFVAPASLQWKQLAQDGVQFKPATYWNSTNLPFQLSSGNRADLLVKAPAFNPAKGANNSYPVYVYNTIDPSDRPPMKPAAVRMTLLTVVVTKDGPAMDFIPEANAPVFPSFLEDITDREIMGTKILRFASSQVPPGPPPASGHTIDGKKFDGELGAVVELNRAEEWKIVNETYPPSTANQISHPFHIHINPFQVTEVFDPNAALSSTNGTGTVSIVTTAPTKVVGTGTKFLTDVHVGDFIWIGGTFGTPATTVGEPPSTVLSVDSDTELTISITAPNAITNAPYVISVPQYTVDKASARPGQCVLDPADENTWKPCGATVPAKDRIWWDVFAIPSGNTFTTAAGTVKVPGYFKMRSRFVDYAGYFVLHCHILAHEDRGMMTVVEVTPVQTPYSHH